MQQQHKIEPDRQRYPYCIVWSPLPPITWLLPFIGHMGLADSDGIIHDFAGPYMIGRDRFAFGAPTRYLKLDPDLCLEDWNSGVDQGCEIYSKRMHNICFDNCHSHVARCLNIMRYDGKSNYNMITLGVWMFFSGSFVSAWSVFVTFAPFCVFAFIVAFLGGFFGN